MNLLGDEDGYGNEGLAFGGGGGDGDIMMDECCDDSLVGC